jgi:hypothetical protein
VGGAELALGALGTLGGAYPENRNSSAAVTIASLAPDETRREAESNFGDDANEHLNKLNQLKPQLSWGEERVAIVEHDGQLPRSWAEGFARLLPIARRVTSRYSWQTFIDDFGRFLDGGWTERAASFDWGPLDLFGCDRERPFARIDHAGLLWLVNGDRLLELTESTATIETRTGARQSWRRKPSLPGRVLAWGIAP